MSAKKPAHYIVMLPYAETTMHVRGIYRETPEKSGQTATGRFVLVRRSLTSKPMNTANDEITWHVVRKGTAVHPLRRFLDTLPEQAKPYDGPIPRIGLEGMLRDRHEAHMKNRSKL